MSHREFLKHLDKPNPETLQKNEELRKQKLARFKPAKARWTEMETFANYFSGQAKTGPDVLYVLGNVSDFKQVASYVDLYGTKLKSDEQIVIYLGAHTGTYIETRDLYSSDIIVSNSSLLLRISEYLSHDK
jgi:hypothetical protein